MSKIHFEITTPERTAFKDEIDSLTVQTQDGEITILPNHIPLVAPLATGELIARKDKNIIPLHVGGGFVEVKPTLNTEHVTRVIILADEAERVEEIDVKSVEEAHQRAKKAMEDYKNADEVKFADATAAFERAVSRMKIARKHARGRTSLEND